MVRSQSLDRYHYARSGFCILVGLFVLIPTPLQPVEWKKPFPLPELEGAWQPNAILSKTHKHWTGHITAPESMAVDSKTGDVYASLNDGRIVRLSSNGIDTEDVLFVGGYLKSGNENGLLEKDLLSWCQTEARAYRLAWNESGEIDCGRPLGLRIKEFDSHNSSVLYILDAYHGLFTMNLATREVIHMFTGETCQETHHQIDYTHDPDIRTNATCKFMNDLDITADGIVYFTDSSFKNPRCHNRAEILDGAARGRLLVYYPITGRVHTLLCGLHFPNGVQLINNEKVLLLVESMRFRILRLDLATVHTNHLTSSLLVHCGEDSALNHTLSHPSTADSTGVSILSDALPGFVDNIRLDSKDENRIFLGIGTKSAKPFSFLYTVLQSSLLRHVIGRIVPMRYIAMLIPKYGLIGVMNYNGHIVSSLHDATGKYVEFISEVHRHPITGDLWIGSHSNPYVGILKASDFNI